MGRLRETDVIVPCAQAIDGQWAVRAPGQKADLNVIDFDRVSFGRPYVAFDLPAGGRRLLQRAAGYEATIVSGAVTYHNGEPTGALPGRVVRGRQVPA